MTDSCENLWPVNRNSEKNPGTEFQAASAVTNTNLLCPF